MNPELQLRVVASLEQSHRRGMIGGVLDEQLAHCASFSSVLDQVQPRAGSERPHAVDLGTGGGIPGLYLAAANPSYEWILTEVRTARATELERAVLGLGLAATVDTRPAQILAHDEDWRNQVDLVTARAFGPTSLVAECAAGLLSIGGMLIVSEPPAGPHRRSEDRWPPARLQGLGLSSARHVVHGQHHFAVLGKEAEPPAAVPRRPPRADRGWWPHL